VYIPSFVPGTGNAEGARLDWASVDDERNKLDEWTLKPVMRGDEGLAVDAAEMEMHDYQLALTGDVFKWMLEYAELETMERVSRDSLFFLEASASG
jgi:cation-transporting ATPase 13A3/4/5